MNLNTPNPKDIKLISRYFDFALDASELAKFEERMTTDMDFQKKVMQYHAMEEEIDKSFPLDEEIGLSIKNDLKADLLKETAPPKSPLKVVKKRPLWRIAASIALLVLSGFLLFNYLNQPTTIQLAEQYWQTSEKITFNNLRSAEGNTTLELQLIEASTAFQNGQFQNAVTILQKIEADNQNNPKVLLLKGEAALNLGDTNEAINHFQTLLTHPSAAYKTTATWFLALAHLKAGQTAAAKQQLKVMIAEDYPLAAEAAALLEQI